MRPMLVVEGVRHSFGGTEVLRGVNLTVHQGEVLGLVGPNGVGKSTLAAVVSGHLRPDAGGIRVRGRPVELGSPELARAAGIGLIEQRFSLDADLSVQEALHRNTT